MTNLFKETGGCMDYRDIYQQYMYSYPHKTSYGSLEGVRLENYKEKLCEGACSLYFHVPFCESKCGYCNLFSVVGKSESFFSEYLDSCERQAEQYGLGDVLFSDVTIGGGTPLLLSENQLERIFYMAGKFFSFHVDEFGCFPIVIETAPNQTTRDKLVILKDNNVSRVSIGVQSFHQNELNMLKRHHTVEQCNNALNMLKDFDFKCLNVDLIYGIKGQTVDSLRESLKRAVYFEPDEIFIYPLYVKAGTVLDKVGEEATNQRYEFYCFIRDFLRDCGYEQFSMRRFVLKGQDKGDWKKECKKQEDNRSCGFENTISIGCGGRSYIGNLHFCTPYSVKQMSCRRILEEFIKKEDYNEIEFGYILSHSELKRRYVIKNLLYHTGVWIQDYEKLFQSDVLDDFNVLKPFLEQGFIERQKQRLVLTEDGMALSDYIGPKLISPEVEKKMNDWKDL